MAWERNAWINRWWAVVAVTLLALAPAHGAATQPATKPAAFELSFPTVDEAKLAIVDEGAEPYFKLLQPLEMAAKTGSPVPGDNLAQQQDACRKRYQAAVQEFTPAEQQAIRWYISKLAAFTYPTYPLLAATPWKFIKIAPEIEGGNPFTRGSYILLSADKASGMAQELANSGRGGSDWLAMVRFGKILLHEQMHVIQRGNRDLFARFYTDTWGFKHVGSIAPDPWLVEHQMLDPDAVDQLWVYPINAGEAARWIWPLSILNDAANPGGPTFNDMRMVAIDLKPGANDAFDVKPGPNNVPSMTALMNVMAYVAKFAPTRDVFNPNEASADLFAHVAMMVDILPAIAPPEAAAALKQARDEFAPRHEAFVKLLASKK